MVNISKSGGGSQDFCTLKRLSANGKKKLVVMFYFCTRGHITKQSGEVKEGMPTLAEILP